MSDGEAFRGVAAGGRYPEADKLWRESLALPIGPHMEEADAQRVIAALEDTHVGSASSIL